MIINGTPGAYLQPPEYGRDDSGPFTLLTWEGSLPACLSNVPAIEGAGGLWSLKESFTRQKCVLTARFPTAQHIPNEVPDNEWELFSQDAEKDFVQSDSDVLQHYSKHDLEVLKFWVESPGIDNASPAYSAEAAANDILILQEEMRKGFSATRVMVPSLRHTQQASKVYQVPNSLDKVGRVFTTEALIKTEPTLPADIAANLPTKVSGTPHRSFGWFKKFPTIRTAAKQKTQIVQEWEYGLWIMTPAIYGALITA